MKNKTKTLLAAAILSLVAIAGNSLPQTPAPSPTPPPPATDFDSAVTLKNYLYQSLLSKPDGKGPKWWLRNSDYLDAVAAMAQYATTDDQKAQLGQEQGFIDQANGNFDKAIADFAVAKTVDPLNQRYNWRGHTLSVYYDAIKAGQKTLADLAPFIADWMTTNPDDCAPFLAQAGVLQKSGKFEDAAAEYALAASKPNTATWQFWGAQAARLDCLQKDGETPQQVNAVALDILNTNPIHGWNGAYERVFNKVNRSLLTPDQCKALLNRILVNVDVNDQSAGFLGRIKGQLQVLQ